MRDAGIIRAADGKDGEYISYISEHISNVKSVFTGLARTNELDDFEVEFIGKIIDKHDESKYQVDEFNGYRQFFFPVDGEEKDKSHFLVAWNLHQKRNPHHWQFWIMWKPEGGHALDMPFEYVIEMLCDWSAMSIKFNNIVSEWYNENKGKMLLHKDTSACIEKYLPLFDKVLEKIKAGVDES